MSSRPKRGGFTLIELLVVVAIIALLIAILLPSLSRAREQARIAKCLANLKAMGTASNTYTNDHGRRDFPWVLHGAYYPYRGSKFLNFLGYTEFIYGGGMPELEWINENWYYEGKQGPPREGYDILVLEPQYRPMNPYFSSSVTWNRRHTSREVDPTPFAENLLDSFKCPSDSTAYVPDVSSNNNETEADVAVATWRCWGSSYPINWYWPYYFSDPFLGGTRKSAEEGKHNKQQYGGTSKWVNIMGGAWGIPSLGPKMLARDPVGGWESKFILFYENRLNLAMEGARPRKQDGTPLLPNKAKNIIGWHRQLDRHSALMLDGHARHGTFDTRFVDGPGWTNWPNKPWKDDWAPYNDY